MRKIFITLCIIVCGLAPSKIFAVNNYVPTISDCNILYYLNNPMFATAYKFNLHDDAPTPNSMDGVSIIQLTGQNYKYAAVYHTAYQVPGGVRFRVNLAVSNDLINWKFIGMLVDNASMPKISLVSGSSWVVVAHEQWLGASQASIGPSRVAFELFYDFNDLINRTIRSTYLMPAYQGDYNGTPSFYEAHVSYNNGLYSVDGQYGFHFHNGTRDVNAVTTIYRMFDPTGGTTAYPSEAIRYNNRIAINGVTGNIGDRDTLITSSNRYNILEGNLGQPGASFDKWRIFLYKFSESYNYPDGSGALTMVSPQTPNASFSFGNPRVNVVDRPDGSGKAIVISYFIFSQGAGPGEAGSLIYYFNI